MGPTEVGRAVVSTRRAQGVKLLVHCCAACEVQNVVRQIELEMRDLSPENYNHNGSRQVRRATARLLQLAETDAPAEPPPLRCTDLGNAERLIRRHGEDLRYCHPWKRWLVWDGRRWAMDQDGEVERRAKETARAILNEEAALSDDEHERARLMKHAASSERARGITAMIEL